MIATTPQAASIEIQLGRGLTTVVDAADGSRVTAWAWYALRRNHGQGWYAIRWEQVGRRRRCVYLHRFLLTPLSGVQVDHINGDTLDNRRANLRLCTPTQNAVNKPTRSPRTGFRGVYKAHRRFYAQITVGGELHSLGRFATAEEAAHAYDQAAPMAFGPFAQLNFAEASA